MIAEESIAMVEDDVRRMILMPLYLVHCSRYDTEVRTSSLARYDTEVRTCSLVAKQTPVSVLVRYKVVRINWLERRTRYSTCGLTLDSVSLARLGQKNRILCCVVSKVLYKAIDPVVELFSD
jgi:hypothetical protein